jgi:uroporphyrinogen III methyltransferase/synthase
VGGKVYLVGCGPGSPDLLTIRAVEVLKKADVVVYDRLIDPSVLNQARRSRKIYCGKRGGEAFKQEEINEILYNEAKRGKLVVRLKNGDPMIFGRGGEELQFLQARGIEVEVVPGLSSATSLAGLAKIPLTQRNISSSLTILTGHEAGGKKIRWQGLGDTVVVLMGFGNLESVTLQLMKAGKKASTLSMIISNGSTANQRFFVAPLGKIAEAARRLNLRAPAVLIVGEVVRSSLQFKGRRVATFRSSDEAERTRKLVCRTGAIPYVFKICDIEPAGEVLKSISSKGWDALIFMSANSVRSAARFLDLRQHQVVAVGNRTRQELKKLGCKKILVPRKQNLKGVKELIKRHRWKKILALRSPLAKEKIVGATNIPAYHINWKDLDHVIDDYLKKRSDFTLLTSAGLLEHILKAAKRRGLKREFVKKVNSTFVISLGRRITEYALKNGIWVNHELEKPTLDLLFGRKFGARA